MQSGENEKYETEPRRWNHPARGLIQPFTFILLAEERDLIVALGRWVFKEACRQVKAGTNCIQRYIRLLHRKSIGEREFQNCKLVEYVVESIQESGSDHCTMEIEITESIVISYSETTFGKLKMLCDLGLKIAIDDFGTGYSTLSHLQCLPVDYLKIDRSFVSEHSGRSHNSVLLSTIISLARSLNLKSIAEGVETVEQPSEVTEMGCDISQDFYFPEPQLSKEMSACIAEDCA